MQRHFSNRSGVLQQGEHTVGGQLARGVRQHIIIAVPVQLSAGGERWEGRRGLIAYPHGAQRVITGQKGAQRAVKQLFAMPQYQHAGTQRRNILHVMGGEQDGSAVFVVLAQQKIAQLQFAYRVQADSRLIQEKKLRRVQQAAAQLRAHALPQAEQPQRRAQKIAQAQRFRQLVQPGAITRFGYTVNIAQQLVAVNDRHIPP